MPARHCYHPNLRPRGFFAPTSCGRAHSREETTRVPRHTLGPVKAGLEKLTAADRKAGYGEEDFIRDGVPAPFHLAAC